MCIPQDMVSGETPTLKSTYKNIYSRWVLNFELRIKPNTELEMGKRKLDLVIEAGVCYNKTSNKKKYKQNIFALTQIALKSDTAPSHQNTTLVPPRWIRVALPTEL